MNDVRNTNDASGAAPYLRVDINAGNLFDLPPYSSGPHGDVQAVYSAVREAGFQGVQGGDPELCARFGLHSTTGGRVDHVGEAAPLATKWKAQGFDLATLHVGTGFESDEEAIRLVQDIVAASTSLDFPLYIETHRATITQDMWRTIQLAHAVPAVRFNGDFSHWYTGQEMIYGDIERKLDLLTPVFERIRFIHGRIGSPGSIQVGILPAQDLPAIEHFKEMWTRSFLGFLRGARPGDYISFTPELLGPSNYARLIQNAQGELVEESDRWQEAIAYAEIAKECFRVAQERL